MAALTEEQSILKDQASSWVETQLPVQKFREFRNSNSDGGFDPQAWSAMVDMGWTGVLVPENYGGSDLCLRRPMSAQLPSIWEAAKLKSSTGCQRSSMAAKS